MIALILFAVGVAVLTPLLQRDMKRAVARRRRRPRIGQSKFFWLPSVENPAAPTLTELNAGVDISCVITDWCPDE